MALTLDKAVQAGNLAAYIMKADEAISGFDQRIADAKDAIRISADLADGTTIREDIHLTSAEMADIYTYLKGVVVAKRNALQAQLDGITTEA